MIDRPVGNALDGEAQVRRRSARSAESGGDNAPGGDFIASVHPSTARPESRSISQGDLCCINGNQVFDPEGQDNRRGQSVTSFYQFGRISGWFVAAALRSAGTAGSGF